MLYKLQEGLDEKGQLKLNTELESTARKIQHPLSQIVVDPAPVIKQRQAAAATANGQVRERKPPPGWLDEKTSYTNAMKLMNATRKKG